MGYLLIGSYISMVKIAGATIVIIAVIANNLFLKKSLQLQ